MKKLYPFLLFLAAYYSSYAQDNEEWKAPGKESQAYHQYRKKITVPPYGLEKINALIPHIKSKSIESDDDEALYALDQKNYLPLSLPEKFTYHMIHPETYSQNCDVSLPVPDEEKKLFAELPEIFGEYSWSERQVKFFRANRDSVMQLMRESIERSHRVGTNYKKVIVLINGKEMIPFLIDTYNRDKKDHDILTVLMLLMRDNSYEPFTGSLSYKKLYADKESTWKTYINFNTANEELIIKRATDFYNGLPK
jgi:hypothetical protein